MSKTVRYESLYKMNEVLSSTQGYRTNLRVIGIDKVIGTKEAMDVENATI